MTTGSPASRNETTELVVPRSMPTAFAMVDLLSCERMGDRSVCAPQARASSPALPTQCSEKLSDVRSTQPDRPLHPPSPLVAGLDGEVGARGRPHRPGHEHPVRRAVVGAAAPQLVGAPARQ